MEKWRTDGKNASLGTNATQTCFTCGMTLATSFFTASISLRSCSASTLVMAVILVAISPAPADSCCTLLSSRCRDNKVWPSGT